MQTPFWIDAHCHFSIPDCAPSDFDAEQPVSRFLLGGVEPEEWKRQIGWLEKYPVHPCFGLHPWKVQDLIGSPSSASEMPQQTLTQILELLTGLLQQYPQALLGETGLDFSKKMNPATFELQQFVFEQQLKLAKKFGRPVILHIVHAHPKALQILKEYSPLVGIVHAYTHTLEALVEYQKIGLCASFGAALLHPGHQTFKRRLPRLIEAALRHGFVLETDSQTPLQSIADLPKIAQVIENCLDSSHSVKLNAQQIKQIQFNTLQKILQWNL